MASNLRSESQNIDNNGKPFHPSKRPSANFNVEADVDALSKSMRCWGTDEETIIKILGNRTSAERQQIANVYRAKYTRTLAHDLDGDLSGHFRDLAILLTETPTYLMAKSLFYAMKGCGTNENTIIEIFVGCTNEELIQLKTAYVHVLRDKGIKDPKRSLEGDIRSETSGYFCKLLLQMLKGETSDPTSEQLAAIKSRGGNAIVNADEITSVCQQLNAALKKEPSPDDSAILQAFKNKNIWQISAMAKTFKELTKTDLLEALKKVHGEFGTLLVALVEHAIDRPQFYSELLFKSMDGAGTRDFLLMRVMVLRSEIDLLDIQTTFDRNQKKSLVEWIKGDTSGDYEKLLLTLLEPTK